MGRLARFGTWAVVALVLPLAACAQSKPADSLGDEAEQRLAQTREAQQPANPPQPGELNRFTAAELQALRKRLAECWDLPPPVRNIPNLVVSVQMKFAPDGSLAEPPKILNSNPDPRFAVATKSVIAGLTKCAPFSFLPPAKYAAWREIVVDFDPHDMFGDKPH